MSELFEQRLAALEREVAELKSRLSSSHSASPSPNGNWIEAISGSMRDEPDFHEVIRLGAEVRRADLARPADER